MLLLFHAAQYACLVEMVFAKILGLKIDAIAQKIVMPPEVLRNMANVEMAYVIMGKTPHHTLTIVLKIASNFSARPQALRIFLRKILAPLRSRFAMLHSGLLTQYIWFAPRLGAHPYFAPTIKMIE